MIGRKKILGLIPARSGSKGISNKNIKPLYGKPLIAWTIEEAKRCDYIDKIIVSTDSKEIANLSEAYGAEVPFLRPEELATDGAKSIEVVKHIVGVYEKDYDIIIFLQPTSPLRAAENIKEAFDLLSIKKAKAVVSVCEAEHSPKWMNTLPEDGRMDNFINKNHQNRQEIETYYRLNGAIYITDIKYFKKNNSFYGKKTFAYIMSQLDSVDIDNLVDFKFAEFLMKEKLKCKK